MLPVLEGDLKWCRSSHGTRCEGRHLFPNAEVVRQSVDALHTQSQRGWEAGFGRCEDDVLITSSVMTVESTSKHTAQVESRFFNIN